MEILPSRPADFKVEGRIAFLGEVWLGSSYLLNVMTGDKITLDEESEIGVRNIHISPDRKWLAYRRDNFPAEPSQLIITVSDGQAVQSIPWEDGWRQLSGWVDNERLWISRERGSDPYSINDSLIVLNPFTGEQQEPSANYPGFHKPALNPGLGWDWFDRSLLIFDPTLSRVVYPSEGWNLTLWDVQAKQEITVVTGTTSFNLAPRWSPDGQRFLISSSATVTATPTQIASGTERLELFSISRDGDIGQLTHLAEHYTEEVSFGNYAWSPDGRYVAFRLIIQPATYPDIYPMSKPQTRGRLAVLDIVTHVMTDYCVPNNTLIAPIWSPNGQQIIIEDHRSISENNVFVIDLTRNIAISLAENATPTGWMVAGP